MHHVMPFPDIRNLVSKKLLVTCKVPVNVGLFKQFIQNFHVPFFISVSAVSILFFLSIFVLMKNVV